ncbi:hypothetical protein IX39_02790 [Chryseobacterium formosense]|uniref:Uncharacterized protein n=1 Tax=Chryseobacterium formosense TaxID=236814 RepID=A0A085Z594_9FLAO|nr:MULTISPECIES: hypothetical protein [Chryseobacterium]KFE99607.1 hypothetical protein IX39_02790 [Chryseobacterium formosense]OCK49827.1 hypothetical protein BA768_07995 [Chryseobacterium sp. CBo1]SFT80231.1 hypothetical protein SAMN05421857_3330 [Chryseobacterium formosense]
MRFKLIFFYFFIFSFFVSAQNDKCKLKINYDLSDVQEKGEISFSVTNLSTKKVKVLKSFHDYKAQLENIFYVDSNGNLLPKDVGTADIDFFKQDKTIVLKPNESRIYKINIFGTFQGSKFLRSEYSYQFDVWFNFIDLIDHRFDCDLIGLEKLKNLKYQPHAVQ